MTIESIVLLCICCYVIVAFIVAGMLITEKAQLISIVFGVGWPFALIVLMLISPFVVVNKLLGWLSNTMSHEDR